MKNNLEHWLNKLNKNQKEFAELLKVSKQIVCKWNKQGIPEKYIPQLEKIFIESNTQITSNGSNVNGSGNSVQHDSHNIYYGQNGEQLDGALCKFDKTQFSEILNLIKELNKHCSVKDSQITFCTDQIEKLIKERDELQKKLLEIYRTGKINRD